MTEEGTVEEHSAQDDVRMIRRMMEDSQRVIYDNGKYYILWGLVIAAALVYNYVAIATELAFSPGWVWIGAVGLGWVLSMWFGWNDEKRESVHSPASRILGAIWIGLGITMTLLGLLLPLTGAIDGAYLSGTMAVVLGTGYFVSGFVADSWLRWLAAGWWVGGAVMLVWPGLYTLLLLAAMLVVLQVGPGLVLRRRMDRRPAREAA